jgi:hypothetical protein
LNELLGLVADRLWDLFLQVDVRTKRICRKAQRISGGNADSSCDSGISGPFFVAIAPSQL